MKKKIHIELLATSALAILLTLLFAMLVFYGLFKEQIVADLKADAQVLKSMHVFDDADHIHPDAYDLNQDNLRITVIRPDGSVSFDSNVDAAGMENHDGRPEVRAAFATGEGSGTRLSATLDKNLFYYALRMENGSVIRISKEADSIIAVFGNMLPTVIGVTVLLFVICIVLANFFTASLIRPIERMADNLADPKTEAAYRELAPFVATIRQQHEDILKNARMRQEFTANVSHELKTPLTAISGYAELIEHGMAGKDDTERFAGEIHKNASRLLTLINDIIQLSQLDDGRVDAELADVDLYELAVECVDMLEMNAQKQGVSMTVSGGPGVVLADRQMMEELIYNLCDNAIRYNNRGGSVTVTVEKKGAAVALEVADTGIGIPKEHQERIFERFYRVDKSRSKATGGTGLGLAIVKHIVSQHGARLSLQSKPGCGTRIRVEFDAAAQNE